jgi:hypothetical protein
MSDEALLDAAAVGKRLGMSKHAIYKMAAAKIIPYVMCGVKLTGRRFDLAEVKAALRVPASHEVSK